MKRIIFLLLLAPMALLPVQVLAQKMKPGVGVGSLKLGMSMQEVGVTLGSPEETHSYAEEVAAYESSGYSIDKELPFFLGFDNVLVYANNPDNNISLPVYKLFFKQDKLNYIILTSYGYAASTYEKLKMKKGIKFLTNKDKIADVFGAGSITTASSTEFQTDYFTDGVAFAIDEEVARAIHFFIPLTDAQKDSFVKK